MKSILPGSLKSRNFQECCVMVIVVVGRGPLILVVVMGWCCLWCWQGGGGGRGPYPSQGLSMSPFHFSTPIFLSCPLSAALSVFLSFVSKAF